MDNLAVNPNPAVKQNRNFTRFAWFNLHYNLFVVLWGAFVRATGSGAGCGSHWPLCNGEIVPRAPKLETLIEFSHRLTSGLALILVIVLFVWARRLFAASREPAPNQDPQNRRVRMGATWVLVLMIVEALVGAGLVIGDLVVDDTSTLRILVMGAHLTTTFFLLAALALTAAWSSQDGTFGTGSGDRRKLALWGRDRLLAACLLVLLITGISGAVSALGVTLYPVESHAEAIRAHLNEDSPLVVRLRLIHPALAVATTLLLFGLARRTLDSLSNSRGGRSGDHESERRAANLSHLLMLMVFAQMAGGLLNIALKAPVWMQLAHLLLADGLWIVLVLLGDALLDPVLDRLRAARR